MTETLWSMSIYACLPFLIVLAARKLLRGYPRVYSYSLWMLVFVRLLIPVMIESPFSIQPRLTDLPSDLPAAESVMEQGTEWSAASGSDRARTGNFSGEVPEGRTGSERTDRKGTFRRVLETLYLAGVLSVAGIFWRQYRKIRRKVRQAVREEPGIWRCEGISSAFVMGLFRPKIYLPYGLEGSDRWYVVLHERMHIRHLDPWVRFLSLAALCLHWWNPVVWYSVCKLQEDMEMYCDEEVMKACASPERTTYAALLLKLSARQSGLSGICFGESHTEQRIRNILEEKRKGLGWACLLFYLLLNLSAQMCLTVPKSQTETVSGKAANPGWVQAAGDTAEDMPAAFPEV